ncbi:hypothetical protein AvCA_34870 [Azotobacter vinelandii CA]|uniref:DUF2059 domain-containing protein n=2 Tax=Azotobacter vinelandii TaxID=354 RepID=C1DQK0_AZOVD|nr:DUF2059 domain-containing protein [Azotobacter vinelandii]ACO79636.1 conserved hypothetical protein [Azotobacter vinelandii DJ]AGK16284.1 hypothetical protein AvCA_34870 [Azotobacter vinelandii CA]AGK21377.1 hypothetical protein AvCA6_34870 [Azotobacter vinelandii CA6]SFX24670.1 hypothetical protein SAMN04244547_00869 [Azotobacter vinelandii]GLK57976.1 hypothetical protein GCM10017624_01330 [Azotobacter vinelandii]
MSRFRVLCAASLLLCASGQALADAASHAAAAEKFLQVVRADKLTVPVYAQVQQMFAQRFAEAKAPQSKQSLLERYQARANTALDKAVSWDRLKPDMVRLYTSTFNESEMKELLVFYQSSLGQKVLQSMPALTAQSAQMTQAALEKAVPEVNRLLDEMQKELGGTKK